LASSIVLCRLLKRTPNLGVQNLRPCELCSRAGFPGKAVIAAHFCLPALLYALIKNYQHALHADIGKLIDIDVLSPRYSIDGACLCLLIEL